jgi:hypothetical protein
VILIDYQIKVRDEAGKAQRVTTNIVQTGRRLPVRSLKGGNYEVLDGLL